MKYIYYCLSLLLLSTAIGCTKEADIPTNEPFVAFNPTLDGMSVISQSRAVSADIDLSALGFSVVGYHTGETFPVSTATGATIAPNIFDKIADQAKTVVRKVNAANGFKLPLAKIPLDDESGSIRTYFSFFAWSVTENKNSAGTTVDLITQSTSSGADKGYPYLNITLPAPNAQVQGDVVAAHSLNAPNDYVVSAVDLDFHHLFSKISFKAKATSGAVVQLKNTTIKYAANALYTQARYQFNASDSVGLWTGYSAYQAAGDIVPYGFNAPSLTATESLLGSMFVIPQQLKAAGVSVVITYTVTINGKESEPIVRAVPLKAIDLCQGKHYTYTLNVETDRLELINLSVSAWKDAGAAHPMPIIPGAMSDVLLLLDGHDKPYKHSDGKWYWLDRSGYNRHCEIVGYADVMYSESDRSYEFAKDRYLIVPPLGSVTELTMNVVAQETARIGFQEIVHLSKIGYAKDTPNRQFMGLLGWWYNNQYNVVFDTEGSTGTGLRFMKPPSPNDIFKKKIMWTFQKKDGKASSVYHNALLLGSSSGFGSEKLGSLDYNLIANDYGGKVSLVQISKKEQSAADISRDFADVVQRYKIDKMQGQYLPVVKNGLIACWDGRSGLLDHNGSTGNGSIWVDQAGEGLYMTANVPAGVSGSITHNAAAKAIVSVSPTYDNPGVYMSNETKFDAELSEITFETVSQSIAGRLNFFMDILDEKKNSIITVRPNTGSDDTFVELFAPSIFSSGVLLTSVTTSQNTKRSLVYTININTKTLRFYQNGVEIKSIVSSAPTSKATFKIGQMILLNRHTFNQAFTGQVYAFRMYDRELTPAEIKTNYDADKTTFGLP